MAVKYSDRLYELAVQAFELDHGAVDAYWQHDWTGYIYSAAYREAAARYAADKGFRRYLLHTPCTRQPRVIYAADKAAALRMLSTMLEATK